MPQKAPATAPLLDSTGHLVGFADCAWDDGMRPSIRMLWEDHVCDE